MSANAFPSPARGRFPWLPLLLLAAALACAGLGWAAGTRASVSVDWSTASEVNTAGFNLYRSAPGAPEVKLNPALIPVQGDALAGARYHYSDDSAAPGQAYEYWLEVVELNGSTSRHGPIAVQTDSSAWALAAAAAALAGMAFIAWRRRL